jgi:hypothetical protein
MSILKFPISILAVIAGLTIGCAPQASFAQSAGAASGGGAAASGGTPVVPAAGLPPVSSLPPISTLELGSKTETPVVPVNYDGKINYDAGTKATLVEGIDFQGRPYILVRYDGGQSHPIVGTYDLLLVSGGGHLAGTTTYQGDGRNFIKQPGATSTFTPGIRFLPSWPASGSFSLGFPLGPPVGDTTPTAAAGAKAGDTVSSGTTPPANIPAATTGQPGQGQTGTQQGAAPQNASPQQDGTKTAGPGPTGGTPTGAAGSNTPSGTSSGDDQSGKKSADNKATGDSPSVEPKANEKGNSPPKQAPKQVSIRAETSPKNEVALLRTKSAASSLLVEARASSHTTATPSRAIPASTPSVARGFVPSAVSNVASRVASMAASRAAMAAGHR